jgi:hypothetical protein
VWILGQWFSEKTVGRIAEAVEAEPRISRRSLARRVCEWLGWVGPDDETLREESGRKALAELERRGFVKLPKPESIPAFARKPAGEKVRRRKKGPASLEVRCDLKALGDLEVIPVSSRYSKDSATWNELMREHHYLGAGPLCGAQIRYLIRSEKLGVLGGLSFSGASKRLKSRDEWVGWSERARRANLQKVVSNSRFLIASGVQVPNLASRALGLALERLPADWEQRYGFEPILVETFVDPERFKGTCYKAANWKLVGETAGRKAGFQNGKRPTGKKQVYLYPLRKDARGPLREEPYQPLVARGLAADAKDWADEEFGGAQVFEGRLRTRLASLARDLFQQPGKAIPVACGGSQAKTKAAYRFLGNRRIDMQVLLRGHSEATLGRAQQHSFVLAVQDTTTVNYSAHPDTEGLGPINTKKDSGTGLVLHSTIGFTLEGTPLGILDAQCWARDPEEAGKAKRCKERPIEEKESIKWLRSYRVVAEAQRACPTTTFVSTGDREADIHELFEEAQKTAGGPKLLIRANRNRQRRVQDVEAEASQEREDYEYLWDRLSREHLAGSLRVHIPRQANRPAREATLEIRFARVSLRPPKQKALLVPLEVWAVYAHEIDAPRGLKEPVDWMLLTTVPVSSFENATERVRWYSLRWGIEVFHRVLKSGTRVEDRQLGDAETIKNCLALDMVVAWRIQWLTKLGRETPEMPCDAILTEDEWRVLYAVVHQKSPPSTPPTLREATRMIAKLGGFLGRKGDGEPGTVTIWRGWDRLAAIVDGFAAARHVRERDGP